MTGCTGWKVGCTIEPKALPAAPTNSVPLVIGDTCTNRALLLRLSAFSPSSNFVRRTTNHCAFVVIEEHFTDQPVGNISLRPLP